MNGWQKKKKKGARRAPPPLPAGVHGNEVMYGRETFIVQKGMKCRTAETMQLVPDVDLCTQRGRLPTQAHSYSDGGTTADSGGTKNALALPLYASFAFLSVSSRRRPCEEMSPVRHGSVKQSPRRDDGKVCLSGPFQFLATFFIKCEANL